MPSWSLLVSHSKLSLLKYFGIPQILGFHAAPWLSCPIEMHSTIPNPKIHLYTNRTFNNLCVLEPNKQKAPRSSLQNLGNLSLISVSVHHLPIPLTKIKARRSSQLAPKYFLSLDFSLLNKC